MRDGKSHRAAMTARVWTLALLSVIVVVELAWPSLTMRAKARAREPKAGSRERSARVESCVFVYTVGAGRSPPFPSFSGTEFVCVCVASYIA